MCHQWTYCCGLRLLCTWPLCDADCLDGPLHAVHKTQDLCMQPTALEDGYSFNTLLYEGSTPNPESLTIRKPTAISTVVLGAKSSANLTTIPLPNTCNVSSLPTQ